MYKRFIFCFAVLGMSWSVKSQCSTIDFEDGPNLGTPIFFGLAFEFNDPFILDGWLWNSPVPNVEYLFSESLFFSLIGPSGFIASSGDIAYANEFALFPIDIQFQSGCSDLVNVESLFMNAIWQNGLIITIDGIKAGVVVANSGNITLDVNTPPSLVSLNFADVDAIQIQLVSAGINDPAFTGTGEFIAIDDFMFCCEKECNPTPIIFVPNSETTKND